jgi:hypothetical protein
MSLRVVVSGPERQISYLRKSIQTAAEPDIAVIPQEEEDERLLFKDLGLRPIEYLVIVFAAHLAASVAHDAIDEFLVKRFLGPNVKSELKVERVESHYGSSDK